MYKTQIKNFNGDYIELEYDNEKYEIEYVKDEKVVILRELLANRTLKVWSDRVGFIKQIDKDGQTHFVMTEYMEGRTKFYHYREKNFKIFQVYHSNLSLILINLKK